MFLRVTQRSIVALLDLIQFVVVGQLKESSLHTVHLLHLAHHIPIDAVHDFLVR